LNVIVKDKDGEKMEIDPEQEYKIVTNSFLSGGGDGYTVFENGAEIKGTPILLRDLHIEYIKKNSPISAKTEGRMANVALGE
ncbi:MAG: 5'-nucleotidase C-terminal domain-containing protein, partial [Elusimicrobia bacterium]|nr:5'-nucleotidase C-terminal domain-containing protein [Elusimicrobiota bacterium]